MTEFLDRLNWFLIGGLTMWCWITLAPLIKEIYNELRPSPTQEKERFSDYP